MWKGVAQLNSSRVCSSAVTSESEVRADYEAPYMETYNKKKYALPI